eukprot:gene523-999_t
MPVSGKLSTVKPDIDDELNDRFPGRLVFKQEGRQSYTIKSSIAVSGNDGNPNSTSSYERLSMSSKISQEAKCRRLVQSKEKSCGISHPDTIVALNELARLLGTMGKRVEANILYDRILSWKESNLGSNHPDTIQTLHESGALSTELKKYDEADRKLHRALVCSEKSLGPEHPKTMAIIADLALLSSKQNHHISQTEELLRRLLVWRETHLGSEHVSTLDTLEDLALLLRTSDCDSSVKQRLSEAEEIYTRLISIRERVQGSGNIQTLMSLAGAAALYLEQGTLGKSLEIYRRVLVGVETLLGPMHATSLSIVHSLGCVLEKHGNILEAVAMYSRAVDGRERVLGPMHADTLESALKLTSLYDPLSVGTISPRSLSQTTVIEIPTPHSDSSVPVPDTAIQMVLPPSYSDLTAPNITSVNKNKNVVKDLDNINNNSVQAVTASGREVSQVCDIETQHWNYASISYHESSLKFSLLISNTNSNSNNTVTYRSVEKAEAEYVCALYMREKLVGPRHESLLDSIDELAAILLAQNKLYEAETMYRRALDIRKDRYNSSSNSRSNGSGGSSGNDDDDGYVVDEKYLEAANGLAVVLQLRGQWIEGESIARQVVEGCGKWFGNEHMATLLSVTNLAGVYRRQKKFVEAEGSYRTAMTGYEKFLGPDHPFTLTTANDVAVQLARRGKFSSAEEIFERVKLGREKALGSDHVDTVAVQGNLAAVAHLQGHIIDAEDLYRKALEQGQGSRDSSDGMRQGQLWIGEESLFADIASNLVHLLLSQKRYHEAEGLCVGVLESRLLTLGVDDEYTKDTATLLVTIYRTLKKTNLANELEERLHRLSLASEAAAASSSTKNAATSSDESSRGDDPPLPPFPMRGVTLKLLQGLRDHVVNDLRCPRWTTTDVCEHLIKPWTHDSQCSFADFIQNEFSNEIFVPIGLNYKQCFGERASIFVSHAWKYEFVELVSSVETFFVDQMENFDDDSDGTGTGTANRITADNTYLWLDLFVNDQWHAPSLPYEWWSGTFLSAIKKIGHTMLVLSPWNDPIPLTRAWCLWEILSTIRTDSIMTVQLSQQQRHEFQQKLRQDEDCVLDAFCRIDVQKSEAWKSSDKEMIFQAVEKFGGGFRGVNNLLMSKLRDWVTRSVQEMVNDPFQSLIGATGDMDAGNDMSSIKQAPAAALRDKILLAGILNAQNRSSEAEAMYLEVIAGFEDLLGRNHPETLRVVARLAALYRGRNRVSQALTLFYRILEGFTTTLGKNHPDTLRTYSSLAAIMKQLRNYDEAVRVYSMVLEKFRDILPVDHRDTLSTLHNLGAVYSDQGSYKEAAALFQEALQGYERSIGADHPQTLRTVHCMAILFQNQKKFKQAEVFYIRALVGFEKALGPKHPDTVKVAANVAALRSYFSDGTIDYKILNSQCVLKSRDKPETTAARSPISFKIKHFSHSTLDMILHVVFGRDIGVRMMSGKGEVGFANRLVEAANVWGRAVHGRTHSLASVRDKAVCLVDAVDFLDVRERTFSETIRIKRFPSDCIETTKRSKTAVLVMISLAIAALSSTSYDISCYSPDHFYIVLAKRFGRSKTANKLVKDNMELTHAGMIAWALTMKRSQLLASSRIFGYRSTLEA